MKYRLVHLTGGLAGRVRDVDLEEVVLGRDPQAAQVVFPADDGTVSRRHALLRIQDGHLLLRDLDSSTGTFVDGHDVEEAELGDGDVFALGADGPRLRVELAEGGTLVLDPRLVPAREAPVPTPPAYAPAAPAAAAAVGPDSRLRLTFVSGTRAGSSIELAGSVLRIGRAEGNAVWTPTDRIVSAQHAKIVRLEGGYVLIDLESRNGTYLGGHRIERSPLRDGDVVGLGPGGPEIRVEILAPARAATSGATVIIPRFEELAARRQDGVFLDEAVVGEAPLVVGRAEDAGLSLDSPIVSRAHARFARREGVLTVEDLDSSNGTFLDGKRIDRAVPLAEGARVVIGPFVLAVADAGRRLQVLDTRHRARLEARGIGVDAGGRPILSDVSLTLPPGSFTAIIGPSGAGKSTLLSALGGARRAQRGQVLLNGADLHRGFAALKASLGYVPQDDIVHRELTVAESLDYTARLRLPPDTSAEERARRVAQVLGTLELTERAETPIHLLSGGQRKRVSIASELLTEPTLLFLDEPTSGLDPGLEEALMLLLRELSYKGKSVVLVTHTLDNIHLCDAVVLLVDGRLVFHGPAAQARQRFGIEHMVNLYARLKEKPAAQWQADFAGLAEPSVPVSVSVPVPGSSGGPVPVRLADRARGARPLRQLSILSRRYLATLTRDTRNAWLLLAQAPLIAGLIGLSLLYGPGDVAFTKPKNTILFLLALTAVWFGCSNAVRELVKERPIYLRERMVNLRILPYLASKIAVLGALALAQCVLFLVILDRWFGIPGRFALLLAGMWLASLVGILLGLAVSALSATADRAMTLLPILLIPQVLFTFPAVQMDMKGPAGVIARAMPTWWSFDLLRRVALAPYEAMDDDALDAQIKADRPVLMTRRRIESMLGAGYLILQHRGVIETTWTASLPEALGRRLPARLGDWAPAAADGLVLAGLGAALLAAAARGQRRWDAQR
jgi:ABC-type multidrug transport system ATPase subunit/pSer/pThr/pTyr-binding forkhead associated (FHA) protein